jgi:hypothetical protein
VRRLQTTVPFILATMLLAACSTPSAPAATAVPAAAKAAAPVATAAAPAATAAVPAATAGAPVAATVVAAATAAAPAVKAAAQTAGRDTCSIISGAELSGVLGKPVTRQQAQGATRCTYFTDDPLVYVEMELDRENGAAAWKGVNEGNTTIGASKDAVTGLGDQAFFGPRDRLYVLKGSTFIAIEAGFDAEVRERAKKVAGLAVTKV